MSKTKHKYKVEDDYDDDGQSTKSNTDRHKQKRLNRALKTKNINELMELDDDDSMDYEDFVPIWAREEE
jgi:hypothetical protein